MASDVTIGFVLQLDRAARMVAQHAVDPAGLHQRGAVGSHGEGRAQLLLRVGDADAHRQHLDAADALLDAQSLLEGDFVERIQAHLDAVEHDPAAVGLDPHAHVVVDDALHTYHDFLHQRS